MVLLSLSWIFLLLICFYILFFRFLDFCVFLTLLMLNNKLVIFIPLFFLLLNQSHTPLLSFFFLSLSLFNLFMQSLLSSTRAGPGVSPARHWAGATPSIGQPQGKKKLDLVLVSLLLLSLCYYGFLNDWIRNGVLLSRRYSEFLSDK